MLIRRLILIGIGSLFFGGFGCAKDLVTGKQTMNWYSLQSDIKLGDDVLKTQIKSINRKTSKEEKEQKIKKVDSAKNKDQLVLLQNIVKRIGPVTHYPGFPYEVHLADLDIANAWCAPGGKIMVFEGLWDPKKGLVEKGNETELAAVLAHEMAHANARHVTEAISRNMAIMLAGTAATTAIHAGAGSQAAGMFNRAASFGVNLYFPIYSRENEREADRIGLMYMAKAGYDPRVAVKLWGRASKKKGESYSIFASHPPSGERARYLKEILPEAMKYYEEAKLKTR